MSETRAGGLSAVIAVCEVVSFKMTGPYSWDALLRAHFFRV